MGYIMGYIYDLSASCEDSFSNIGLNTRMAILSVQQKLITVEQNHNDINQVSATIAVDSFRI